MIFCNFIFSINIFLKKNESLKKSSKYNIQCKMEYLYAQEEVSGIFQILDAILAALDIENN